MKIQQTWRNKRNRDWLCINIWNHGKRISTSCRLTFCPTSAEAIDVKFFNCREATKYKREKCEGLVTTVESCNQVIIKVFLPIVRFECTYFDSQLCTHEFMRNRKDSGDFRFWFQEINTSGTSAIINKYNKSSKI